MNQSFKPEELIGRPHLSLTLTPEGTLQCILPDGRSLDLKKDPLHSIFSILHSQLSGLIKMGEPGAPTRHQQWHIECHSQYADERCIFCQKEGRIKKRPKRVQRAEVLARIGDVQVRRISRDKAGKVKEVKVISLEDL